MNVISSKMDKRFDLLRIKKQVNTEITTFNISKFKIFRLVDVLLLMIITTTLTTIHCESSPQTTLLSTPQNSIQEDGDSPSPSETPKSMLQRRIRTTRTSESEVKSKLYGGETKQQQLKHFVSSYNNASAAVSIKLGGSNQQLKHHQETNPSGQSSQSIEHVNLESSQNYSLNNFTTASMTASPQTTTQILIENENETIVPDSIDQNENKILKTSYSLPLDSELMQKQQVSGGLSKTKDSLTGISGFNNHQDNQLSSPNTNFERRFGLFKKGQHQHNNLAYSSFFDGMANGGTFGYSNDCESCLLNSGFTNPQKSSWMYEQSFRPPMKIVYPQPDLQYDHYAAHQFRNLAHLKGKFNKFSKLPQTAVAGNFFYGHNFFPTSYRSKTPIASRLIPYHTQKPYNCVQSELLSSSSEVLNQESVEKAKPLEQEHLSYHPNLQY